jgi:putative transposon-encoded protein
MEKNKPQNKQEKEGILENPINNDEILEREVTAFGNSCHIPIPSKHLGKMARVIILGGHHPCEECGKPVYNKYEELCEECRYDYANITKRKGKELLIEILEKALKNPKTSEENKEIYKKYLRLIEKGNIYDHFYNFIYTTEHISRKKGEELDEGKLLSFIKNARFDVKDIKEGGDKEN